MTRSTTLALDVVMVLVVLSLSQEGAVPLTTYSRRDKVEQFESDKIRIDQAEKYRIADSLEVAAERAEETRFAEQAFTLTTSHGHATHCFQ
jgi:hypothetical protein